jgi:hypothetical protein
MCVGFCTAFFSSPDSRSACFPVLAITVHVFVFIVFASLDRQFKGRRRRQPNQRYFRLSVLFRLSRLLRRRLRRAGHCTLAALVYQFFDCLQQEAIADRFFKESLGPRVETEAFVCEFISGGQDNDRDCSEFGNHLDAV